MCVCGNVHTERVYTCGEPLDLSELELQAGAGVVNHLRSVLGIELRPLQEQ